MCVCTYVCMFAHKVYIHTVHKYIHMCLLYGIQHVLHAMVTMVICLYVQYTVELG